MKQLVIYGTKEMLNEVVSRLDLDWEVKLNSGDVPVRPDLALEIVLEKQKGYKDDEPYYALREI